MKSSWSTWRLSTENVNKLSSLRAQQKCKKQVSEGWARAVDENKTARLRAGWVTRYCLARKEVVNIRGGKERWREDAERVLVFSNIAEGTTALLVFCIVDNDLVN